MVPAETTRTSRRFSPRSEQAKRREKPIKAGDVVRGRVIAIGASSGVRRGRRQGRGRDRRRASSAIPQTGEVQARGRRRDRSDGRRRRHALGLDRAQARRRPRRPLCRASSSRRSQNGIPVEGPRLRARTRAATTCSSASCRAFCPGSQIDRRRGDAAAVRRASASGSVITKLDPSGRNVVVSRRQLAGG